MANVKNVAGKAKYILSGKNIKDAIDDKSIAEKGLSALKKAKNLSEADKEALKAFENIDNRLGKVIKREKIKTYGARAGVGALGAGTAGAGAYGIYRHNKNKKEKTAYDIVVDAFEKIAELTPQQQRALNGLQGIRNDIEAKKPLVGGISRTEKDRVLENAKKKREAMMEIMKNAPDDGKITLGEKAKALLANKNVRRGVIGATALGAGATGYGVYRHNKKKKEKTALDIVVDSFEKMGE